MIGRAYLEVCTTTQNCRVDESHCAVPILKQEVKEIEYVEIGKNKYIVKRQGIGKLPRVTIFRDESVVFVQPTEVGTIQLVGTPKGEGDE